MRILRKQPVSDRQRGVRSSEIRICRDCIIEVSDCATEIFSAAGVPEISAAKIKVVRPEIVGSVFGRRKRRSLSGKLQAKRLRDRARDVVLDIENIFGLSLVHVGPEGEAVCDVRELRRHTQSFARAANSSLEYSLHVQPFANVLERKISFTLERKGRSARRYAKSRQLVEGVR